jgi:hypothetical protein
MAKTIKRVPQLMPGGSGGTIPKVGNKMPLLQSDLRRIQSLVKATSRPTQKIGTALTFTKGPGMARQYGSGKALTGKTSGHYEGQGADNSRRGPSPMKDSTMSASRSLPKGARNKTSAKANAAKSARAVKVVSARAADAAQKAKNFNAQLAANKATQKAQAANAQFIGTNLVGQPKQPSGPSSWSPERIYKTVEAGKKALGGR